MDSAESTHHKLCRGSFVEAIILALVVVRWNVSIEMRLLMTAFDLFVVTVVSRAVARLFACDLVTCVLN